MGFSRQEYWSGLPFPSPGDLSNPGIKPGSPTLQVDSSPSETPNSMLKIWKKKKNYLQYQGKNFSDLFSQTSFSVWVQRQGSSGKRGCWEEPRWVRRPWCIPSSASPRRWQWSATPALGPASLFAGQEKKKLVLGLLMPPDSDSIWCAPPAAWGWYKAMLFWRYMTDF